MVLGPIWPSQAALPGAPKKTYWIYMPGRGPALGVPVLGSNDAKSTLGLGAFSPPNPHFSPDDPVQSIFERSQPACCHIVLAWSYLICPQFTDPYLNPPRQPGAHGLKCARSTAPTAPSVGTNIWSSSGSATNTTRRCCFAYGGFRSTLLKWRKVLARVPCARTAAPGDVP